MSSQTIELVLKVLEIAGPIIAQVPTLGAKWIKNRDEVAGMVREGREPTPQEHARLTREMHFLTESLGAALATAEDTFEDSEDSEDSEVQALASEPAEVADVVEAAVTVAAEVADAVEVLEEVADDSDAGTLDPSDEFEVEAETVSVETVDDTVEKVVDAFAEEEAPVEVDVEVEE
ncbi:hypothetical protein LCGC14_1465020 [marine sediment metagenome]|uniref:Uncharacterized protein n=1 Tax=marine sediment metagenome TaxID=412755 RepID=A0A0F9JEJ2_9ZZZZ